VILLVLLLSLKVPDAQQFVGAPQGTPVAEAQLYQRTHEVASLLRCPVCQGMSVADSPAEMAINMKEQVRELLARGYTEEQILKYFELSYGQFVLLKPKSWVVWALPMIVLVLGVALVIVKIRKLQGGAAGSQPAEAPAETDPYLAQVRDLVSGEKP
jgi:cytochrome c-type biogenesis protein CcmH